MVAGGIPLSVNKNGNPGTLVPAHPGNTNAASRRLLARLIQPREREIEAELLQAFEFTATSVLRCAR